MKTTPGEIVAGSCWYWVMNELTPRGHLRPLGGRENPRRARPESRSPRRCARARGAPYSPRAAPSILTKGEPTGTRAQVPSRSCTCAKALTETHPGVRDWLSATRICMQSKLGTPSWPLFLLAAAAPRPAAGRLARTVAPRLGSFFACFFASPRRQIAAGADYGGASPAHVLAPPRPPMMRAHPPALLLGIRAVP